MDYFILLTDSVTRYLTFEEGKSLLYNLNGQIRRLEERQTENVPSLMNKSMLTVLSNALNLLFGYVLEVDIRNFINIYYYVKNTMQIDW